MHLAPRGVALMLLVAGLIALGSAGAASAQEYSGQSDRLSTSRSASPGGSLDVSGSGFKADTVVNLALANRSTGEALDLGTLAADAAGVVTGSISLPDGLDPGTYTVTATGVTGDGATRVLSTDLEVAAGIVEPEQAGELFLWIAVGLAGTATAGSVWLLATRRHSVEATG
jgi:hypothetical protein